MKEQLETLVGRSHADSELHKPELLRIHTDLKAAARLQELLQLPGIRVYDDIYSQLKELIKSRNPGCSFDETEMDSLIHLHLRGTAIYAYGVWAYYPWSGRLVHILDEAEYVELRTSANRNKISIPERDVLASKKVGVIGLSVGQSVSVTLAMERGFGELRLADFDTLELNNLNRIRTGVHNLGLRKVYSVAREIAEIDPYLKVICYPEGITDENIHAFFTHGGKLDLVIDECDGVNVKIMCRLKAKELQVPVLMEASDRGTLDIERFDLEPERPIMHGWLEHLSLDLNVLKELKTNEQKLPYMLPIAGFDTLSKRMKASLVELNYSITTWPQLATAVTLGGAITADTCRRIFLGQLSVSGRYFIDMEELVAEPVRPAPSVNQPPSAHPTLVSVKQIQQAAELTPALAEQLVTLAVKAPSFANAQPWKFVLKANQLILKPNNVPFLYHNRDGATGWLDLGRAAANLQLAAYTYGYALTEEVENGYVRFYLQPGRPEDALSEALAAQLTSVNHRQPTPHYAVDAAIKNIKNGMLTEVFPAAESEHLSKLIRLAARLDVLHPDAHADYFQHILRWPGAQAETGVTMQHAGLGPADMFFLKIASDPSIATLLAAWPGGGRAFENTARRNTAAAEEMGIIWAQTGTNEAYHAGKLIQKLYLDAMTSGRDLCVCQNVIHHLNYAQDHADKIPVGLIAHYQEFIRYFSSSDKTRTGFVPKAVFYTRLYDNVGGVMPSRPFNDVLEQ